MKNQKKYRTVIIKYERLGKAASIANEYLFISFQLRHKKRHAFLENDDAQRFHDGDVGEDSHNDFSEKAQVDVFNG